MDKIIDDGGPAFPSLNISSDGSTPIQGGMSLRDRFAIAALTGILASIGDNKNSNGVKYALSGDGPINASFHAYRFADAMILTRIIKP